LHGKEQYLVKWAADEIVKRYVSQDLAAIDFVRLDAARTDAESVISHCETLPLGSEKKVVLLDGAALFAPDDAKAAARFGEEALEEYLPRVPQTCMLVITALKADKRKKAYKTLCAAGGAYEFTNLDPRQLAAFIDKRLRAAGKSAPRQVVNGLAEAAGYFDKDSEYTLFNLDNDLKKLVAYCGDGEVGMADVAAVMSGDVRVSVFAISDAVSRGAGGEAFRILRSLLSAGESVYKLLGLLFSHFDLMLSIKELRDSGAGMAEAGRRLGVNEYRLKIAAGHAARFSRAELRELLKKAFEVDKNIKTGLLRDELALEMFIFASTSGRGGAAAGRGASTGMAV
jgi:DNA polymerase-3 subunit delta